jgi:hypothetical protein
MTEMMFGFCVSQIIRTAADMNLADHLAAGPLTVQEIAKREGSAAGHDLPVHARVRCAGVGHHGWGRPVSRHRAG